MNVVSTVVDRGAPGMRNGLAGRGTPAGVALLLVIAACCGIMAIGAAFHASIATAAGPGQYSAPVWLPLRSSAKVGCVRTNCPGPYHGYWAIDFLNPQHVPGDPVYAAGAGQVTILSRSTNGACGQPPNAPPANALEVNHGGGVTTVYYHLASFSVGNGAWVDQNTQIGVMGSTGYTDPCPTYHLHFEKRINGTRVDPGPLKACQGAEVVTYPSALGYDSWDSIPDESKTVSSGGTACDGGGVGPPSVVSSVTSYTGATAGDYGDGVTLSAGLVDGSTSAGLAGRSIGFSVGAQSCSGVTDGAGNASCSVTLMQAPGVYTVEAAFAGDSGYTASSDSKAFTIRRKATRTTYGGPGSSDFYDAFTASASLVGLTGGGPVVGRTVTLTLGAGDSCSGVTDASGSVACSITPTQGAGAYSIVASFAGDSSYLASADSKPFTITKEETVTSVVADPAGSSKFGQPVSFTAVSAADAPGGAPAPTGSSAFVVDGNAVGSAGLEGGSARTATSSLRAGSHAISASYSGDGNFLASSCGLPYTVTCDVNVSGVHPGSLVVTTMTCLADGSHVTGAIIVKPGGALDVEASTVDGAIGATQGAGVIRVCGSAIGGAVDVKNSGGLVLIGAPGSASCAPNQVGGALDVKNDTHGVETVGNKVGGASATAGNSGPATYSLSHVPASQAIPAAGGVPSLSATSTAKPLAQARYVKAIKACNKLKKPKRRACVAATAKRHALGKSKTQ